MSARQISAVATSNLDAKTVKSGLTWSAVRAVYEALGVVEMKRNSDSHVKCRSPLRPDSDRNPSFSINRETGYWEDFANGEKGDIFDAVMIARSCQLPEAVEFVSGFIGANPQPSPPEKHGGDGQRASIVATYVYNDASGEPYMAVDRDANKNFFQKRPNGQGGWLYGLKGLSPIPFHLDQFPKRQDRWLLHVEGEKDADRAILHGSYATTSPGGSKGWKDALKVHYQGLSIAVIPDNDDPGWAYAQAVASSLHGVAHRVRIVELPGLGPRLPKNGKDLSDWYDAGHTVVELNELIDMAPDWHPDGEPEPEQEEVREPRFRLLTPADLMNRPAPRYIVEGMLIEGSTSAIVGPPAVLKSFVAKSLGFSIASGIAWNDRPVLAGPVVYVSAEGSAGLPARIRAWEIHHKMPAPDSMYFLTDAPQLMEPSDVEELLFAIHQLPSPPILVVVDTLARTMVGGEENSAKDMGVYVSALDALRRETGAHVMTVHHEGKSGDMRGSTALRGALDTEISIKRDDDLITLTCKKQKDAAEFEPITLIQRVVELGDGQSSVILESVELTGGTVSMNDKKVMDVLIDTFGAQGATTTQWLTVCKESGITERTFYRARKNLVERGLVVNDREGQRGAIFTPVFTEEEYQSELAG